MPPTQTALCAEVRRRGVHEPLHALGRRLTGLGHREHLTRPGSVIGVSTDRSAPIGIFDSGVGGLTVARAVLDRLPAERIRYVGDTAHAPYGPRPVQEIRSFSMDVADSLVDSGVKMLVIACNTAASAGVRQLAERRYPVPVMEVISPAVRRAIAVSKTRHIGVIGTSATISSGAYRRAFAAAAGDGRDVGADVGSAGNGAAGVTVHEQACPSFVDFVERGITSGRQITGLTQAYLDPLQKREIDTLVLGCTHYPLLAGVLQRVMGERVTLVSSADQTALDVLTALTAGDLLAQQPDIGTRDGTPAQMSHEFIATGDQAAFDRLRRRFLGPAIGAAS